MQVFRGIPQSSDGPCALTIGNFDGVHLGHQALLAHLREAAAQRGLPTAVLTFDPSPREFFAPELAPPRLVSLRRKLELLAAQGIDRVYVCRFNAALAALEAEQFAQRLVQGLRIRHLIIGDDFRFGRGRKGDFTLLQAVGQAHGFAVEAMHTVDVAGERVSSSAVRDALLEGDMEHAARLLGSPFEVVGRVMHGDKIGRTISFPTANIQLRQRTLPLAGIFAVTVDGGPLRRALGAASIGVRPTIGERLALRLEVYVLDFDGDLYHQQLHVKFWHKVRNEAKFPSLPALQAAINQDCDDVRAFFAAHPELTV